MTVEQIVKKYIISVFSKDGEKSLSVDRSIGKSPADIAFVKSHKAEIIAHLEAIEAAAQETAAHTVRFYVVGWESHEVSIDDRKDLAAQYAEIAAYYAADGITADMVKAAYDGYTNSKSAALQSEIADLTQLIADNDGKDLMSAAQYGTWAKSYNNLHNEGGEGYIPPRVTQEGLQYAKYKLAQLTAQ